MNRKIYWTYSPKYRNLSTGTVYHRVDFTSGITGLVRVETNAGSIYLVRLDSIEEVS